MPADKDMVARLASLEVADARQHQNQLQQHYQPHQAHQVSQHPHQNSQALQPQSQQSQSQITQALQGYANPGVNHRHAQSAGSSQAFSTVQTPTQAHFAHYPSDTYSFWQQAMNQSGGFGIYSTPFSATDTSPISAQFHFNEMPPLLSAGFEGFHDIYSMGQADNRATANTTNRNGATASSTFPIPPRPPHQVSNHHQPQNQFHRGGTQQQFGQHAVVPNYYSMEQGQFYFQGTYMGQHHNQNHQHHPNHLNHNSNFRGRGGRKFGEHRQPTNQVQNLQIQYNHHHFQPQLPAYEPFRPLPPKSKVMWDFRHSTRRMWNLSDIEGHIVEFCGDQDGSRFIQQKLDHATEEKRKKLLQEIEPDIYALMSDVFGNYVVQKLFEVCDQQEKATLAGKMEGHVLELSHQVYGCRVVQKAMEHVLKDQRDRLTDELRGHVIECVKGSNANHVIQRMITLEHCPDFVVHAFVHHVEELGCHPFGCRVLQKMFETLPAERLRVLLDEMHRNILRFAMDQFGNYVVQSVIVCGTEEDRNNVIMKFKGSVQQMCRHKFASNVIEKALTRATENDRRDLIVELMDAKPNGSNKIALLLKDPYANFPVQTALTCAEPVQRDALIHSISNAMKAIRHSPVGRNVEQKLQQLEQQGINVPYLNSLSNNTSPSDTNNTSLSLSQILSHDTTATTVTLKSDTTTSGDAMIVNADSGTGERKEKSQGLKGHRSADEADIKGTGTSRAIPGSGGRIGKTDAGGSFSARANSGNGRGRTGMADTSASWRRKDGSESELGTGNGAGHGKSLRATRSTPPMIEVNESKALEELLL